ncbi:MAG TPA: SRPBCC family protein [Actinomycetota bacterium]|nr:SRPBCC family protein [Actinomycetota bacterium]
MARVVERNGLGPMSATVRVEVEVQAPAEAVWGVISDPGNLPHWNRHIVRVTGVPSTGLTEGTQYVTEMRFMAVRTRVQAQVLEWEPPRRATFRLRGILDATVTSTVEPLDDGRSRLEHVVEYRFRGGLVGDLAARSLALVGGDQHALRHGTLAQKREIEERTGPGS